VTHKCTWVIFITIWLLTSNLNVGNAKDLSQGKEHSMICCKIAPIFLFKYYLTKIGGGGVSCALILLLLLQGKTGIWVWAKSDYVILERSLITLATSHSSMLLFQFLYQHTFCTNINLRFRKYLCPGGWWVTATVRVLLLCSFLRMQTRSQMLGNSTACIRFCLRQSTPVKDLPV
jgi:hypothetical protein